MAVALCVLATALASERPATAFHPISTDHPSGALAVPGDASAVLWIDGCRPGDTLQWRWTVASGSPAALSTQVRWHDASGRMLASPSDPAGQTYGTFVAPRDFHEGLALVWQNAGPAPVTVQWEYGVSPDFWRRPDILLPALIPVLLLIAAYAGGRLIDARARRRASGP